MAYRRRYPRHYRKSRRSSHKNRRGKKYYKHSKSRKTKFSGLKLWHKIIISFIIAVIISILSINFDFGFLGFLNFVGWVVFSFYLYKRAFIFVNSLDLANDLYLWLLRGLGVVIAGVGLYFGLLILLAGSIFGLDAFSVGTSIIFLGLAALGIFMVFRSKRRYPHLFINR